MVTALLLRRANVSRPSGSWSETDCNVFDGDRDIGRIFPQADGARFWGVSFQLTGRKSYGRAAASLDEAKAAFRAEYATWTSCAG
jgi:hypothetical protein